MATLLVPVAAQMTRLAGTSPNYTAATPTAAGDLIANDSNPALVVPLSFAAPGTASPSTGAVVSVQLTTSAIHQALVRVHLWHTTAPTVNFGDNGTISLANTPDYIGFVDVSLSAGPRNNSVGGDDDLFLTYSKDSGATIFALLEFRDGEFAPASAEILKLSIGIVRVV